MKNCINRFEGDYSFLSNFYPTPVYYEGLIYPSSEHAYQSAKSLDFEVRKRFMLHEDVDDEPDITPGQAKRMGRQIPLRGDWEDVKIDVMTDILRQKFMGNSVLAGKLLATGVAELIEGTTWHDIYWGIDLETGEGENHLGKILMQIRDEIQSAVFKLLDSEESKPFSWSKTNSVSEDTTDTEQSIRRLVNHIGTIVNNVKLNMNPLESAKITIEFLVDGE